jgi:hypothetical protein
MILDYAGPRKRSQFRLASRSLIDCTLTPGGAVVVREWLAGQAQAVISIVVASGMLILAGIVLAIEWPRTTIGCGGAVLLVIVSGFGLIPAVVQQSWRETVLTAGDGMLRLRMGGPLSSRSFAWEYAEVDALLLIGTQRQPDAEELAEIEILAARTPPIRLFTDHPEARLKQIHEMLARALKV